MKAIAKYLPDNKKKMVAVSVSTEPDKIGRILGEISSEAIWVKDDDEIEIKLQNKWKNSKWQETKIIALVKCTNCKTYH